MILYKNILRTKNVYLIYPYEIRVHEDVIFCLYIWLFAFFCLVLASIVEMNKNLKKKKTLIQNSD